MWNPDGSYSMTVAGRRGERPRGKPNATGEFGGTAAHGQDAKLRMRQGCRGSGLD